MTVFEWYVLGYGVKLWSYVTAGGCLETFQFGLHKFNERDKSLIGISKHIVKEYWRNGEHK